jgi:hypothetical protein
MRHEFQNRANNLFFHDNALPDALIPLPTKACGKLG